MADNLLIKKHMEFYANLGVKFITTSVEHPKKWASKVHQQNHSQPVEKKTWKCKGTMGREATSDTMGI